MCSNFRKTGDSGVEISIIVAAYNEEPVIAENIKRIVGELHRRPEISWELICVNDGSKDKTGELIEKIANDSPQMRVIHHTRNFGQGRALRTAFAESEGSVFVTLDADLSYGPEYIYQLVDALEADKADIALASPYTRGGTVRNVPFYRYFLSRIGNFYLARMSQYKISTSTCVVRAYKREVIDNLFLTSDGMELQLEVLMKSSQLGYHVCEVPARLEWADEKVAEADFKRASKMKILQTIRLYLLMGWLSKPAFLFMTFAMVLLTLGLYMLTVLSVMILNAFAGYLDQGVIFAISQALRDVFSSFTYSFVFCGSFIIVGLLFFATSLLFLQNKFYFDEISKMNRILLTEMKSDKQVKNEH